MTAGQDVYKAIADPTRRAIINLVAAQPRNVNAIAEQFDMTRQATSLHINILIDCGLITIRQQGRERICEAHLQQLGEVAEWVGQYKQFYERKLDALEKYLEKLKKEKYGKPKK